MNSLKYSRQKYEKLCYNSEIFYGLHHEKFQTANFQDKQETKLILNPPKMQEGLYTCKKCKSKKTNSWEKQTRSADEPSTTFVACMDCNHRWSIAG